MTKRHSPSADKHCCPMTSTAELLSDTWTMLVMRSLSEKPKRYNELRRWLGDISTRTLTLKLKKLTSDGLIEKGPDGAYRTTAKGKGLRVIERAMISYAKKYLQ